MKFKWSPILVAYLLLMAVTAAVAAPPYDLTVESAGTASTGGPADTIELWRDCEGTPVLVDSDVQAPETYPGLITADGTYTFCTRGRNAAGLADIGLVVDVSVNAIVRPGPIDGGTSISVQCPNGPCVTSISVR